MKDQNTRKALYVVNAFYQGGAEKGLVTLLEHGFMQGVDFRVFVFARGNQDLYKHIAALIGEDKIIIALPEEKLSLKALFLGVFKLARTLWGFCPSVVILSLKQSNIIGRAVLTFFPFIYCIGLEHSGRLDEKTFASFYKRALQFLSYRVDEVWADCHTTLEETKLYYFEKSERLRTIIPLYVCQENLSCKKDYEIPAIFRLVMAGRLISCKRHDLVLEAMAQLRDKGIKVSFTIYGTGSCEGEIRAKVQALSLEDNVFFKGFVENWWQESADYDVFVHPSEREGFCIVAAEAMMIGLPVVLTPQGGVKDYSIDDVDALHVETGSTDALVEGLQRLYDSQALRRTIGMAAAETIRDRFDADAIKKELLILTDRIV